MPETQLPLAVKQPHQKRGFPWWGWLGIALIGGAFLVYQQPIVEQIAMAFDKLTGKPKDFAQKFVAAWQQTSRGLPAELLMPQAALETGWGTSDLAVHYNNLFGIKGGAAVGTATEWDASTGQYVTLPNPQGWKVFNSWSDAIEQQIGFLKGSRYWQPYTQTNSKHPSYGQTSVGLPNATTLRQAWESLKIAGYATQYDYEDRIAGIAKTLGLDPDAPQRIA